MKRFILAALLVLSVVGISAEAYARVKVCRTHCNGYGTCTTRCWWE